MKHVVSVSIGSSKRDKVAEIELMGEKVRLERIGTDGDMEKAAQLFKDLDGKVDALGVGGTDLGLMVDNRWYPLHSVSSLVRDVKQTPLADGSGLKNTLERRAVPVLESKIKDYLDQVDRKVFVAVSLDRWGMAMSFIEAKYNCILGDFMFSLGIPFPIRQPRAVKIYAAILMPIVGRLPFSWIYPTGEKQEQHTPKFHKYYNWASIIAGDCHYIKRFMPSGMDGKIVVTNTTTPDDVEFYRKQGVRYLMTTTPVLDGRSFGTNLMEAALIAVSGKNRPLTRTELNDMLDAMDLKPQLHTL